MLRIQNSQPKENLYVIAEANDQNVHQTGTIAWLEDHTSNSYSQEMTIHRISRFLSVLTLAVVSLAPFCSALGQENPDSAAPTSPPSQSTSEFTKAAEEVIQEMSKITGLAQKAPVKIIIVLALFIFPAMFVVILGPAVMQFMQNAVL